jgi:hypothetical protein
MEPLDWTRFNPPEGCPLDPEECGGGLRESCGGCPYWNLDGEWIGGE